MSQPDASTAEKSVAQSAERRSLTYTDTYPCPICRHGQVATMPLMDAFACSFCRHVFTANLREQSLRVEDSSQPMTWRWNGRRWQIANQVDMDLSILLWLLGGAIVILPPFLIWLSSYIFPPLQDSPWFWFPTLWFSLVFISHFSFVAWVLLEHYQVPLYISCKVMLQDWCDRR
jgi:hypothetical protein